MQIRFAWSSRTAAEQRDKLVTRRHAAQLRGGGSFAPKAEEQAGPRAKRADRRRRGGAQTQALRSGGPSGERSEPRAPRSAADLMRLDLEVELELVGAVAADLGVQDGEQEDAHRRQREGDDRV